MHKSVFFLSVRVIEIVDDVLQPSDSLGRRKLRRLLLAVCFLSGKIAEKLGEADEKKLAERSLIIKLIAAGLALVLYLVTFLS